jgi:hypothetical protein
VGSGTVNVVGSHGPPPGDGDAAGDALDEDDPISDPVVVVLAAMTMVPPTLKPSHAE